MKRFVTPAVLFAACVLAASPGSARMWAADPAAPAFPGTGPKAVKDRKAVRLPDRGPVVVPAVDPAGPVAVGPKQHFVIASDHPLVVIAGGGGKVTVKARKPPFMLPVHLAVGYKGDDGPGADPEFVTFTEPFIYDIQPTKSGAVGVELIPSLNLKDDKGEQIPLAETDVKRIALDVDDGTGPRPPPAPGPDDDKRPKPPPEPPAPTPDAADPTLTAAFRAAAAKDGATKADLSALGKVYTSTAGLLSINDPNVRPKLFGDVYTNLVNASTAAGVPRPPALNAVRTAIDADVGRYGPKDPVTDTLRAELIGKFKRVGTALIAAGQ